MGTISTTVSVSISIATRSAALSFTIAHYLSLSQRSRIEEILFNAVAVLKLRFTGYFDVT